MGIRSIRKIGLRDLYNTFEKIQFSYKAIFKSKRVIFQNESK